ncbi:MAG: hypothetical protein ACTSUO_06130 [Candidatus Thorarchaeota archaeon]
MNSAQDGVDRIFEAEEAAKKKIEAAEKQARTVRESGEDESKKILAKVEELAKDTASKKIGKLKGDTKLIEKKIQNETTDLIHDLKTRAERQKATALTEVINILTGEAK